MIHTNIKQFVTIMNLNLVRPLVLIDLETTGTDIAKDRIVQIAILKVFPDGSETLIMENINPTISIPIPASEVHGIYDDDVAESPTFAQVAPKFGIFIGDSDIAGFNSNRFDIPLLLEEFSRAKVDFKLEGRNLVDVQTIFHKMEPRNLQAAYKLYCGKELIGAHNAESDIRATYEVLKAQIEYYENIEYKDKDGKVSYPIANNLNILANFTPFNLLDPTNKITYDEQKKEIFTFGKYKGRKLEDVCKEDPNYYEWILNQDFSASTKKILKQVREKIQEEQPF
jgi:DNA polymerase-3 subunit epsilon